MISLRVHFCIKSEIEVVIWNVITLRFLLIIGKKTFEKEKHGEIKSCDAASLSEESSKLPEGMVYFVICVSTLIMISKITVDKVKKSRIDIVPGTVEYISNLERCPCS